MNATHPTSSLMPRPTLARVGTGLPAKSTEEIAAIYVSGVFADPKPQKAMFSQREIVTDGHKRLLLALREECQALHASNRNLRQRVSKTEDKLANMHLDLIDARQAAYSQQSTLELLKSELEEANRSLGELDDLMRHSRSKRLSRMSAIINDDGSYPMGAKDDARVEGVGAAQ